MSKRDLRVTLRHIYLMTLGNPEGTIAGDVNRVAARALGREGNKEDRETEFPRMRKLIAKGLRKLEEDHKTICRYYGIHGIYGYVKMKFIEHWLMRDKVEEIILHYAPSGRYEAALVNIEEWIQSLQKELYILDEMEGLVQK